MRGSPAGWMLGLAAIATLAGCKREPTFDERYAGAQKALQRKAAELDQDMAARASEAAQDEPSASPLVSDAGKI